MIPVLYLKLVGAASIVAVLAFGYWWIDDTGYDRGAADVQVEFDKYKGEQDAKLLAAKIEKARIEAEQTAKHDKATLAYLDAKSGLDFVLARLRDSSFVLRKDSLQVAGNSSALPSEAADTSKLVIPLGAYQGACSFDFYAAAMKDNLQCQALIDFVK
jgi:hypothetical protein